VPARTDEDTPATAGPESLSRGHMRRAGRLRPATSRVRRFRVRGVAAVGRGPDRFRRQGLSPAGSRGPRLRPPGA